MNFTKSTWATRLIPTGASLSLGAVESPVIGDVVACEVLNPSLHGRVETREGSRSKLYPGDTLACVVGHRYATSMLEGAGVVDSETIHLLSASGVCGRVLDRADRAAAPTTLRVLGQAHIDGRPVNLRDYALGRFGPAVRDPLWIVVVGSAMDAGKTTACASLVAGLRRAGCRVGAAKLTGTTSARDVGSFRDAGAHVVFDFADLGWPSTAGCDLSELHEVVTGLAGHLRASGVDVGVLEIADGLLQSETQAVLEHLQQWLGRAQVVLAARESLAAIAGVQLLNGHGLQVLAVTGVVSSSPLARREVETAGAGTCLPTAALGRLLAPALAEDALAVSYAEPVVVLA